MRFVHIPSHRAGAFVASSSTSTRSLKNKTKKSVEPIGLGSSRRGPSTQVELSFSARNLANRDWTSKSDPVCIIYRASVLKGGKPQELARTEMIKDNLSPDWARKIKIDYYFESKQPLVFKIYDIDFESGPLQDQDFLGSAKCDLADIVASPNSYLTMKLGGQSFVRGDLIIHAQEIDEGQRETLCFNAHVSELSKRSLFSKPNVYLEFHRFLDDGTRHLALRTSVQENTLSPNWLSLEIPIKNLCNCNKDREFLVECYDFCHDGSSPHFVGSTRATVNQLLKSPNTRLQFLKESRFLCSSGRKKTEKASGTLTLETQLRIDHTFLDYVAGGLQLEFACCIDFTASNGHPHSLTSLHYIDSQQMNQYEVAIRSVLEICEHYNHQKLFDAVGFGAKIPPKYEVSHLFPLDLDRMTRRFVGVDGVLRAYRDCIKKIELYGPTHFGPSISEFMQKAKRMPQDGSQYQILLILTDGSITDMNRTKDYIIRASEFPISIIIIGVGESGFKKMDQLDSDATLLESKGKQAKRDIVQFVPFRDFVSSGGQFANETDYLETMGLLAKEVLAEVPSQVTSYMRMNGLKPRTPVMQIPTTIPSEFGGYSKVAREGAQLPSAPLHQQEDIFYDVSNGGYYQLNAANSSPAYEFRQLSLGQEEDQLDEVAQLTNNSYIPPCSTKRQSIGSDGQARRLLPNPPNSQNDY